MNTMHEQTAEAVQILKEAHADIDRVMTDPSLRPLKDQLLARLRRDTNMMAMNVGAGTIQEEVSEAKPLTHIFGKPMPAAYAVESAPVAADFVKGPNPLADDIDDDDDDFDEDRYNEQLEALKDSTEMNESRAKQLSQDEFEALQKNNLHKEPVLPNTLTPEQSKAAELLQVVSDIYPKFLTIDNKGILDTYGDLEIRGVAVMAGLPFTETEPAKITSKTIDQIKTAIKKNAEIKALGEAGTAGVDADKENGGTSNSNANEGAQ